MRSRGREGGKRVDERGGANVASEKRSTLGPFLRDALADTHGRIRHDIAWSLVELLTMIRISQIIARHRASCRRVFPRQHLHFLLPLSLLALPLHQPLPYHYTSSAFQRTPPVPILYKRGPLRVSLVPSKKGTKKKKTVARRHRVQLEKSCEPAQGADIIVYVLFS